MPVMVKARNSVTRRSSLSTPHSGPEVVALVADEPLPWWIRPHEFSVLHVDDDEATWRPLGRRPRRGDHSVAVEVVDLLELGDDRRPRRLGPRLLQRLHE